MSARIYVASLSDYNAGNLHGVWIDVAGKDAEEIQEEVNAMLAESMYGPAEEWAIHDYEGFAGIEISEYEPFTNVVKLAEMLEEHGEAFAAWWDNGSGGDMDSLEDDFLEAFAGEFTSLEDYAAEYMEGVGGLQDLPESLQSYFDFAAFGRDMVYGGDIWTHEAGYGRVFIFYNF